MHNNKYAETVDKIKAPEGAVENALETARNYEAVGVRSAAAKAASAKRTVRKRKVFRYAVAAVLALAVALGAILGPGLFGKKADKKRKLYNGMIKCDLFQYGLKK